MSSQWFLCRVPMQESVAWVPATKNNKRNDVVKKDTNSVCLYCPHVVGHCTLCWWVFRNGTTSSWFLKKWQQRNWTKELQIKETVRDLEWKKLGEKGAVHVLTERNAVKTQHQLINRYIQGSLVVTCLSLERFKDHCGLRRHLNSDEMEVVSSEVNQFLTVPHFGRVLFGRIIVDNDRNLQFGKILGTFQEVAGLNQGHGSQCTCLPRRDPTSTGCVGDILIVRTMPQRCWKTFDAVMTSIGIKRSTFWCRCRYSLRDMEGHVKKCVERFCELTNKTTQQLYKISTPCLDDHQFKEEELEYVGGVVKWMLSKFLEMSIFDTYWTIWYSMNVLQTCTCDHKHGSELVTNIQYVWSLAFIFTSEYKQFCHVGNTVQQFRLCLFQDFDTAGDLEDSKSTSGGTFSVFGRHTFVPISWMCKKQTCVSHSSIKSEIISVDTELRMDGIPVLDPGDLDIIVIHSNSNQKQKDK